jgi:gas vesicle protein
MEEVEMNGNKCSAFLIFITGLGAGMALTVLLAPRSGAATRRLISRRVEDGQKWMKDKVGDAEDYVKGYGEEFRDRVKEVAEVIGRK